jgi:hypothetical protein
MNIEATLNKLKEVQQELEQLRQFAALLHDDKRSSKQRGRGKGKGKRAPMSEEARKKISAAQKRRWAKTKKAE